jgi:stage III sporulation protein AG
LNDNNTSANSDTVTVTDSDRNENGLIRQINPPVYSGAVVVCQGADNPQVKLSIIDAVGKLTGLGSDKISVIKMK